MKKMLFLLLGFGCTFSCIGQIDADLLVAIKNNDLAAVEIVLGNGIDVNGADENGATALMWVVYWGDLEMVKKLVAAGASTDVAGIVYLNTKLECESSVRGLFENKKSRCSKSAIFVE